MMTFRPLPFHPASDDLHEPACRLMARYQQALQNRARLIPIWRDCYDVTLPEPGRISAVSGGSSSSRANLFDGTAPDAVDQLAASLLGQLTPPWVNWVGLGVGTGVATSTLRERLIPVLARSTAVLQDQLDRSNLHTELHQCFLDLVIAGTACLVVLDNPVGSDVAFRFQAVPLADLVLDADEDGQPTRLFRPRTATGATIRERFQNLSDSILTLLENKEDQEFDLIEFSETSDSGAHCGTILQVDGQYPVLLRSMTRPASPYIVFRWMKSPGETYGRSPVMKALPDIKTANKVVELTLKNASIAVTGIWQAEDDGVLNMANIDLVPGAIIPKAVGSAGLKPLEMPARFDVSQLVLSDLRTRIRHALLADRFSQMDSPRLTATEVRERADDATLILGAIYGRLQSELLTPLVMQTYDILRSRGEIDDLPLDGQIVQILHRSPLARAQMARGLRGLSVWIDAVSQMGPDAANSLNKPQVARYLADIIGIPEQLMNDSISSPVQTTSV